MKPLLAILALASALHGQTAIWSESFDASGVLPPGWQKASGKFGTVANGPGMGLGDGALTFTGATGGSDVWSAGIDLRAYSGQPLALEFDFYSTATTNHALLVGIGHGTAEGQPYLLGSPSAQSAVGQPFTFAGSGIGWTHVSVPIDAYLAGWNMAQLSDVRIFAEQWAGFPTVSNASVFADNFAITTVSAIPEPSCGACVLALAVAGLVVWRRRGR